MNEWIAEIKQELNEINNGIIGLYEVAEGEYYDLHLAEAIQYVNQAYIQLRYAELAEKDGR